MIGTPERAAVLRCIPSCCKDVNDKTAIIYARWKIP